MTDIQIRTSMYIKEQLDSSLLNSTVGLIIRFSSCTNTMIRAGMFAYTERLGVTRGKGIVIAVGQLELARSASAVQFLQCDFFGTSSVTAAPSPIYLRSLDEQENSVNT